MRALLSTMILVATLWAQPSFGVEAAWQALRTGGTVALLRHARAPGTGDPAGFRLDDCSSQRNLSEEGRRQSRGIGAQFRTRGVVVERVLSSRWCRSLETARLAFGSKVEPYPPLDSFFSTRDGSDRQTQEVHRLIEGWRGSGVLVLVTHQVNITALTGVFPAEGEILVLRPRAGGFDLVDRIQP
ncbi:MAG TPA: histidine phosphatase family protein [Microvirga sp.]|nr:histidine phosphatase family protein [Microvirga sp.]